MKLFQRIRIGRKTARAFTLTELMIASSISIVTAGGVLMTQFYGLRVLEATSTQIETSSKSRRALDLLTTDLQAARNIRVGTGTVGTFAEATRNTRREGNSILIYPGTNTNVYVKYYLDASRSSIRRMTNNSTSAAEVLTGVTNTAPFRLEDFRGTVLTNSENRCVVGLSFIFNPTNFSRLSMGTGAFVRSYELRAKIARRETD